MTDLEAYLGGLDDIELRILLDTFNFTSLRVLATFAPDAVEKYLIIRLKRTRNYLGVKEAIHAERQASSS